MKNPSLLTRWADEIKAISYWLWRDRPWTSRLAMGFLVLSIWLILLVRIDVGHYYIAHYPIPSSTELTSDRGEIVDIFKTRYGGYRYVMELESGRRVTLSCRSGWSLTNDCFSTRRLKTGMRLEIGYFRLNLPWYADTSFDKLMDAKDGEGELISYESELQRQAVAREKWIGNAIRNNVFMFFLLCFAVIFRWRFVKRKRREQTAQQQTTQ